jgi:Rrf2 family protein
MMFSKSCEYALRAVIHLCMETNNGSRLNIKEIAGKIDTPEPFTAKILQVLARQGVISSQKGPGGGFYIDPNAAPIPVIDVIDAIDGKNALERCGLGLKACADDHPCPIHDEFMAYRNNLKNAVTNKTVQELAVGVKEGKFFLTNAMMENAKVLVLPICNHP